MPKQTLRHWLAAALLAGSLAAGGLLLDHTFAQDPAVEPAPAPVNPQQGSGSADEHAQEQKKDKQKKDKQKKDKRKKDKRKKDKHKPRKLKSRELRQLLIQATADLTGAPSSEVRAQLAADKSLAQIAQERGTSAAALVDAVADQASQRLAQAVASGKLTQAQADERLARLREHAAALVQEPGMRGGLKDGGGQQELHGRTLLVQATAQLAGLTPEQVRAQLRAGKSLAQMLQEQGQRPEAVIDLLRAQAQERLERQLERARQELERVPER